MKINVFLAVKFAVLTVFFIVSGFSGVICAAKSTKSFESYSFSNSITNLRDAETEIFDLVNKQRHRKGLIELEWNDDLAALARNYSSKMARDGFFDHFDQDGATVIDRAENARIKKWSKIGENLFFCEGVNDFSFLAVKGWMKSPTHKDNILDGDWTDSGIGVAESRNGEVYVTQVFIEK